MPEFEIKNYRVETIHFGKDADVAYQRFIILEGPPPLPTGRGIRQEAILIFMDDEHQRDNVGSIGGDGALLCVLRIRDFRDVYDILRNEKPVFCNYSSSSRSVHWLQIITRREPVGEGPVDTPNQQSILTELIESGVFK